MINRTGELSTASYGTCFWDSVEETLKMDMSMEKVSAQKLLYMFADYEDWSVCPFFMLALYRISGNGNRHITNPLQDDHWIFPNLAMAASPAKKMNSILKSLVPEDDSNPTTETVAGLTKMHTGTGFRIGSINNIVRHPNCGVEHAVMRSGHDHTNICSVFEYLYAQAHLVATAGRALQEYPSPKNKSPQPRLLFLNEENKVLMANFMTELFGFYESDFSPSGKLWEFAKCIFATFLMHVDNFLLSLPAHHFLVLKLQQISSKFQIATDQLRQWGELIRQDFYQKNAARIVTPDSFTNMFVPWLQNMENMITGMASHMSSLDRRVSHVQDTIAILRTETALALTSRKRSRNEEEIQEEEHLSVDPLQYQEIGNIPPVISDETLMTSQPSSDPEPRNLIPQTPLYEIQALKGLHLSTIFENWYSHQLYLDRYHSSVTKQIKGTIRKVVQFTQSLTSKEELMFMNQLPPGSHDPEYAGHITKKKKLINDVCQRVLEHLKQHEPAPVQTGRARPAPTLFVSAICTKIDNIRKNEKTTKQVCRVRREGGRIIAE